MSSYCYVFLVCLQLASLKTGLLPIGQEAVSLGEVKYYEIGGSLDNVDHDSLARIMGPNSKVRISFISQTLRC